MCAQQGWLRLGLPRVHDSYQDLRRHPRDRTKESRRAGKRVTIDLLNEYYGAMESNDPRRYGTHSAN
ncbi:MAG: hypothetical protein ACJ72A_12860, partial [Nocardioidaceae bacterium]